MNPATFVHSITDAHERAGSYVEGVDNLSETYATDTFMAEIVGGISSLRHEQATMVADSAQSIHDMASDVDTFILESQLRRIFVEGLSKAAPSNMFVYCELSSRVAFYQRVRCADKRCKKN